MVNPTHNCGNWNCGRTTRASELKTWRLVGSYWPASWADPRPGSSHICRSCANEQREIHRAASAALEVRPLTRSAGDALPSPRRVREVFRKTEASC